MSDSAREFDVLLESFLQRAQAGSAEAQQGRELPTEVAGEDLQLLQVAMEIRRALAPEGPDQEFLHNSEIRLKNQMKARITDSKPAVEPPRQRSSPLWHRLLQPIPVIASLILVLALTLGSVGVVGASAASLPGDALYPVKRGLEQARLAVSRSDEGDAELLAEFARERVEEIEELTAQDRLGDVDQAVEGYLELTGQLDELAEGSEAAAELESELANNIQVLERVLEQVPAEAQPAIQRAIERSRQREELRQEEQKETQEQNQGQGKGKPSDLPNQGRGKGDGSPQNQQNERTTEQIANQYEVSVEAVQTQFEGDCEGDWQCVREHFRVQEQNQRFAEQIARQNDTTPESVMQVYEGVCSLDWGCVRAHYRGDRPGGGPPDDIPRNN